MGKYINHNSKGELLKDKVKDLVSDGAVKISPPTEFKEGLVCVVDNFIFTAAGYAYDEQEMKVFLMGLFKH